MSNPLDPFPNEMLITELRHRKVLADDNTALLSTEQVLNELRTRLHEYILLYYPPPHLKADYRFRIAYQGLPAKLVYLMQATIHEIMVQDRMIHVPMIKDATPMEHFKLEQIDTGSVGETIDFTQVEENQEDEDDELIDNDDDDDDEE